MAAGLFEGEGEGEGEGESSEREQQRVQGEGEGAAREAPAGKGVPRTRTGLASRRAASDVGHLEDARLERRSGILGAAPP